MAFGGATEEVEEFAKNAINQFGLSEYAAKNMASTFMAIGTSMGINEKAARTMSIQLSGLAADLASFYNTSVEDAYAALQSVYTGMVRPMRAYGVNLTMATLQEYALTQGITKSVSAMNQAELATLRYNYILQATTVAQNDFIRTQTSWHNSLVTIKNELNQLAVTMGAILMKALGPVVAMLGQVVAYAVKAAQALAALFGIELKFKSGSGGGVGNVGGDIADGMDDAADATNGAAAAAKKYKKLIEGFDELHIMDSTGGNHGGGGGGGGGLGDLGGGGFDVGSYFDIDANPLEKLDFNNWLQGLDDWILKYRDKIEYLGTVIGEKFNALFDYVNWPLLGKTVVDGLNAIFASINNFFDTADFINAGSKIATMINAGLEAIEPAEWGQILINKYNAAFQALYGFVNTLDWELLTKRIQEIIANALEKLDLATIKSAIETTVKNLTKLIKSIDFYEIGYAVGTALSGVNWLGVFKTVKDAIWSAYKGFWDGFMSDGKNYLIGTIGKIHSWFKESFFGPIAGFIAKILLGSALLNVVVGGIRGFMTNMNSHFGTEIAKSAFWVIGNVTGFGNTLAYIFEKTFGAGGSVGSAIKATLGAMFTGLKDAVASGGVLEALKPMVTGIKDAFIALFNVLKAHPIFLIIAAIVAMIASIVDAYKTNEAFRAQVQALWDKIKGFANFCMNAITTLWTTYIKPGIDDIKAALSDLWNSGLKTLWNDIKKCIRDIQDNILTPLWQFITWLIDNVISVIIDKLQPVIAQLVPFLGGIIKGLTTALSGLITFLSGVFSGDWKKIWESIKKVFTGIMDAIVTFLTGGFMTSWSQAWTAIKNKVVGIWDGITSGIKGAANKIIGFVNGVISGIERMANGVVAALNRIQVSLTVPSWVPGIGGNTYSFGVNMGYVSLPRVPYLAQGGVIDQKTLAMIGEYPGAQSNPEIVSPVNTMRDVFSEGNDDLIDVMIQIGSQIVEAINNNETSISIGDDIISAAAARGAKNYKMRTGRNQFAY